MSRIRTIKPEFWTDEKVVELSAFARLLFIGIWNFCDDEGRMVFSPKRIKMQIFPADSLDTVVLFDELRAVGLIHTYTVADAAYLQVAGFAKHQKIDKRSPSKLPSPPNSADSPRMSPPPADPPPLPPTEGKGWERKGKDAEAIASDATINAVTLATYSKDELWVAGKSMLEQSGMPAKQCGSFVGKLVKDYGPEVAIEAVRAAVLERPADAVAYLKATCLHLAGQRKSAVPWYATEQGVLDKARDVGLVPHPGESASVFKLRIEAALSGKLPVSVSAVVVRDDPPERVVVSAEVMAQRSALLRSSLKKFDA